MSDKRKVTVDGEEFEVDIERNGEFWNVEIEGMKFSIKICLLYTSPSPRD